MEIHLLIGETGRNQHDTQRGYRIYRRGVRDTVDGSGMEEKDTIQGLNVNPPKCNCRLAADRIAENKKIREDADRNKNGVCRHLMQLNEEWDNFRVEGTEYLKRDNAIMVFENGEDGQAVQVGTCIEHTKNESRGMA